jgi:hypothetical protein
MGTILLADALNDAANVTKTILSGASILIQGAKFMVTELGGIAIKINNKTGGASVKGTVVSASSGTATSFAAQSNEFDSIGVVYTAGIADGSECWVIIAGIAEVLWKDSTASTMGRVALADAVDGRASDIAVPSSNPVVAEHFKEIGHVMETQAGGTNVLVTCILHFN